MKKPARLYHPKKRWTTITPEIQRGRHLKTECILLRLGPDITLSLPDADAITLINQMADTLETTPQPHHRRRRARRQKIRRAGHQGKGTTPHG